MPCDIEHDTPLEIRYRFLLDVSRSTFMELYEGGAKSHPSISCLILSPPLGFFAAS